MSRIVFFGGRGTGIRCLEHLLEEGEDVPLVVTTNDRSSWSPSLLDYSMDSKLNVMVPGKTNDPTLVDTMSKIDPEILYSVYYSRLISRPVLNLSQTAINFHGGLLPEYKGCNSNIWAIINGETYAGSTAHYLTPEFDSGDIVGYKIIDVDKDETGKSLYFKTADATVDLFKTTHEKVINGTLTTIPRRGEERYYSKAIPRVPRGLQHDDEDRYIRALHFPPMKGPIYEDGTPLVPYTGL